MKICPNCQTPYDDYSLKFCLHCGTPLPESSQTTRKTRGNAFIVAAILGGFMLLALVVGGIGIYLFSRSDNETDSIDSQSKQNNLNEIINARNEQTPVVQINGNKQSVTANQANVAHPTDLSENLAPRIMASSSSVRKSDAGNFYFPNFAFDNNSATAWCEGARGAGIDEWLQFNFDHEVMLRQIKIQPGYFKNDEAWRKNNRVAKISVGFSDDSTREFSLSDERKTQTLDVGAVRTKWVKITIKDFFAGASDSDDTLISEVSFVTAP